MIKTFSVCLLSLVISFSEVSPAKETCEPPALISPEPDQVLMSHRPVIAWLRERDTLGVDVELLAYVPEGEVVQRLQRFFTESHWQPELKGQLSAITLLIHARSICKGTVSEPISRRFHLDLSQACPAPVVRTAAGGAQGVVVEWLSSPSAGKVEVVLFETKRTASVTAAAGSNNIHFNDWNSNAKSVAGVRALCAQGVSAWTWREVASP